MITFGVPQGAIKVELFSSLAHKPRLHLHVQFTTVFLKLFLININLNSYLYVDADICPTHSTNNLGVVSSYTVSTTMHLYTCHKQTSQYKTLILHFTEIFILLFVFVYVDKFDCANKFGNALTFTCWLNLMEKSSLLTILSVYVLAVETSDKNQAC
jgi:hypothetical protein